MLGMAFIHHCEHVDDHVGAVHILVLGVICLGYD